MQDDVNHPIISTKGKMFLHILCGLYFNELTFIKSKMNPIRFINKCIKNLLDFNKDSWPFKEILKVIYFRLNINKKAKL